MKQSEEKEHFFVTDRGNVLAVRSATRKKATQWGFKAAEVAEVETVVAELASNLVKHTRNGGDIILRRIQSGATQGLEIISRDDGPGIADLNRALNGGFSTAGSLGIGLSGVKRLMDEFSIETGPEAATVITTRKWLDRRTDAILKYSVLATPFPGESVSGDGYFIKRFPEYELFAVIDGLGHGMMAHTAKEKCIEILEQHSGDGLSAMVQACHQGLRHTCGVAMALGCIMRDVLTMEHVSIGNVDTRVYNTPQTIRPFCFNGTLGMNIESGCAPQTYPITRGGIIVMCSDGNKSQFDVPARMFVDSPQYIAENIFSNHVRGTDDATVLVAKVS